jgi:hypothetical protein
VTEIWAGETMDAIINSRGTQAVQGKGDHPFIYSHYGQSQRLLFSCFHSGFWAFSGFSNQWFLGG